MSAVCATSGYVYLAWSSMLILAVNYYHKLSLEKLFVSMENGAFSVEHLHAGGTERFKTLMVEASRKAWKMWSKVFEARKSYVDRSVKYEMLKCRLRYSHRPTMTDYRFIDNAAMHDNFSGCHSSLLSMI